MTYESWQPGLPKKHNTHPGIYWTFFEIICLLLHVCVSSLSFHCIIISIASRTADNEQYCVSISVVGTFERG